MPKAPTWAEAQAMRKRLSLISQKAADLYKMTKDEKFFSGLTEAEREVKLALVMEERDFLVRQYARLSSQMRTSDFSGMTEADRAAEAERLKQEALEEARRLKMERDHDDSLRQEGWARIVDFDPKQGGLYINRYLVDLATISFDHDEESPLRPMRFTSLQKQHKRDLRGSKHLICQDSQLGCWLPNPSLWHCHCERLPRPQVHLYLPP